MNFSDHSSIHSNRANIKSKSSLKLARNLFKQDFNQLSSISIDDPSLTEKSMLNHSPLKNPLENAIQKVVNNIHKKQQFKKLVQSPCSIAHTPKSHNTLSSRNLKSNKSVLRFQPSEFSESVEQDKLILQKMHPQTIRFLKKYFSGYSSKWIPIVNFTEHFIKVFNNLWCQENAKSVLPEFIAKLQKKIGMQYVSFNKLHTYTKENGLIGLVLDIFKEIKEQKQISVMEQSNVEFVQEFNKQTDSVKQTQLSIQNVKDIIQEFTEGLHKQIQDEIIKRVNVQLRRLVIKYKEAEALLRVINEKINLNIDKITFEMKKKELEKQYQEKYEKLNTRVKGLETELYRQKEQNKAVVSEREKLETQNKRLSEKLDRMQNYIINDHSQHIFNHQQNSSSELFVDQIDNKSVKQNNAMQPHKIADSNQQCNSILSRPVQHTFQYQINQFAGKDQKNRNSIKNHKRIDEHTTSNTLPLQPSNKHLESFQSRQKFLKQQKQNIYHISSRSKTPNKQGLNKKDPPQQSPNNLIKNKRF